MWFFRQWNCEEQLKEEDEKIDTKTGNVSFEKGVRAAKAVFRRKQFIEQILLWTQLIFAIRAGQKIRQLSIFKNKNLAKNWSEMLFRVRSIIPLLCCFISGASRPPGTKEDKFTSARITSHSWFFSWYLIWTNIPTRNCQFKSSIAND